MRPDDGLVLTPLAQTSVDVASLIDSPLLGTMTRADMQKRRAERQQAETSEVSASGAVVVHSSPADIARAMLNRRPPEQWEQALRRISPKSDTLSWLHFVWKETPRKPESGRWVLYQMVPVSAVEPELRQMLDDVPYWEKPADERVGRSQFVTAIQWVLWREFKCHARPFWCLQGEHGGTPLAYSELEEKYLRLAGQPTDPPARGSLSYAPWDSRVETALVRRDRLFRLGGNIGRLHRSASDAVMKAEIEEGEKQFRKDFLAWWSDRLQPQSEFLAWYTRKTEADQRMRRQTREESIAAQELEAQYVEHGIVPSGV